MKQNASTEPPVNRNPPPGVLTAELAGRAYGVSFLPWDPCVQLEPVTESTNSSGRIKGAIVVADRLVPVFDLRQTMETSPGSAPNPTYLLVISMASGTQSHGTMAMGLLVEASTGKLEIPTASILNFVNNN